MKKLLALMLLLVTVIILAVPTPALAWGGWSSQTAFVALAQAAVTDGGNLTDFHQIRSTNIWVQSTNGEVVQGQILQANRWPAVVGAGFRIDHHSTTYLNYDTMKITGTAEGTISVAGVDANGNPTAMSGTYKALIRGSFSLDADGNPTIYDRIFDGARWTLSGTAGGDTVTASGFGFANLQWTEVAPGFFTLAGPMILTGVYK